MGLAAVFQSRSREWRFSRRARHAAARARTVLHFARPFRLKTAVRLLKLKGEIP
jgi:hypothetical protein